MKGKKATLNPLIALFFFCAKHASAIDYKLQRFVNVHRHRRKKNSNLGFFLHFLYCQQLFCSVGSKLKMYFVRHILDGVFVWVFSISVTVDLLSKEHWKENMKLLLSFLFIWCRSVWRDEADVQISHWIYFHYNLISNIQTCKNFNYIHLKREQSQAKQRIQLRSKS